MESVVAESGSLIVASTPQEFAAFLRAERTRMQELVRRTGAKLD
jgi:tripartite-type tricarboxylate transporter receptor subunit TctC